MYLDVKVTIRLFIIFRFVIFFFSCLSMGIDTTLAAFGLWVLRSISALTYRFALFLRLQFLVSILTKIDRLILSNPFSTVSISFCHSFVCLVPKFIVLLLCCGLLCSLFNFSFLGCLAIRCFIIIIRVLA